MFIGIIPAWGFQTFLCLSLAVALRLNKALAFIGSNISIPPFIPFIVFLSLWIGGLLVPNAIEFNFNWQNVDLEFLKIHLLQYVVGSFLLAIFASIAFGGLFYLFLKTRGRNKRKHVE